MGGFWRRPLAELRDARSILDFCERYAVRGLPVSPVYAFENLISGPEMVLDLWCGDQRAAVAVIVDSCSNSANAADLLVLAWSGIGGGEARKLLVKEALASLAGTGRRLDIALVGPFRRVRRGLEKLGFRPVYATYDMVLPKMVEGPPPLSPPETIWRPLERAWVEAYWQAVRAAFADVPGASIPPLESFCRSVLSAGRTVHLLVAEGRVAGFVSVMKGAGGRVGIVHMIGLVPAFRQRGWGRHLLANALDELAAQGCRRIELEVTAGNERALRIYQSFGFNIRRTVPVMGKNP